MCTKSTASSSRAFSLLSAGAQDDVWLGLTCLLHTSLGLVFGKYNHGDILIGMDVESLVWSAARRLKQGFEWLYTSVDVLIPYFILGTLTSTLQYHSIPGSYTLSMLSSASHTKTCAYCNPWLAGSMPVLETRPTACSPPSQAKPSHFQTSHNKYHHLQQHHFHHYHCSPSPISCSTLTFTISSSAALRKSIFTFFAC